MFNQPNAEIQKLTILRRLIIRLVEQISCLKMFNQPIKARIQKLIILGRLIKLLELLQ